MKRVCSALLLVLMASPGPLIAEETGLDEALQGFGEERSVQPGSPAKGRAPDEVALTGSLLLSVVSNVHQHRAAATGTEYGGLSRLRLTLDLGMDVRFSPSWDAVVRGRGFHDALYGIRGREAYTQEVVDSLENEAELREAFLRGKVLSWLDLKLGRQIVVWGRSDNLRVTDVLNPLDNREPGMVDIEDLRLPVAMVRADGYAGPWNLSAVAIPEIRFNKEPPYGSDFYPYPVPPPPEEVPDDGGKNTEYAIALNGVFPGWDLSFYAARVFDDEPSARFASLVPLPQIRRVHDRISMQGAAMSIVSGSWLYKAEAALFSGLRFAADPEQPRERIEGLLGLEYAGFNDTTLSIEAVHRRVLDHTAALELPPDLERENEVQTALRIQRNLLHDRMRIMLVALRGGWDGRDGALQRLSCRYELTDRLSLRAGYVNYRSGESPEVSIIGRNDRVFVETKYSF